MSKITEQRLLNYLPMRMENERRGEALMRLRSQAAFAPSVASDGSQHNGVNKDKLENAVLRYADEADEITTIISRNNSEMRKIRDSISSLADPMERELLRLRYIDGAGDENGFRRMTWPEIAEKIYGGRDERHMMAIHRLRIRALQNIKQVEV